MSSNTNNVYKIEKVVRTISRKHTCKILFLIRNDPVRFTQLVYEARVSPGALSDRLKDLLSMKVIEKSGDYYKLTEKGNRLVSLLEELLVFSD